MALGDEFTFSEPLLSHAFLRAGLRLQGPGWGRVHVLPASSRAPPGKPQRKPESVPLGGLREGLDY